MTEKESLAMDQEALSGEVPKDFELQYSKSLVKQFETEKYKLQSDYRLAKFLGKNDKKVELSKDIKTMNDAIEYLTNRIKELES